MIDKADTVPRLSVKSVSKSFPGVKALSDVSLEVWPGEVHALCGENGAGKSTLMRLIAGVESADVGEVILDGQPMVDLDEHAAQMLGVGMVHQERSLIPGLTIAENVFAGRQPVSHFGIINTSEMNKRAKELLGELNVNIDPRTKVYDLSPADAQMVEIAKALSHELRLLILDEPTAALTITETEQLFSVIRSLTERGVSVIYISHRLAEVFEICDKVTVLKDGSVTGHRDTKSVTQDELIRLMVGREISMTKSGNRPDSNARVVLEVSSLGAEPFVKEASFSVHEGEIVCLAGLIGAGRSEVCETIFGVRARTRGMFSLNGKALSVHHPADAMKAGIAMVPEDRKEAGLFLSMNIIQNISVTNMDSLSPNGIMSERMSTQLAKGFVEKLRIVTPHVQQSVVNLSGGNQQKVLLAKWLARKPSLLIVDEPTRGVDVGARSEIYRVLRELAASGVALLVVSSDLPEVLTLAHRIVVMSEGYTVGELDAEDANELKILQLAAPKSKKVEAI